LECTNIAAASGGEDSGTSGGPQSSSNDSLNTAVNALVDAFLNTAEQAAKEGADARLVIGRVADLQASDAIGADEYTLLDKLTPGLDSVQGNWYRNASVLRTELRTGITQIRDASPGDSGGQFLNAERNLLQNRGWTFDPITSTWYAP
jgi:hypothetical protein